MATPELFTGVDILGLALNGIVGRLISRKLTIPLWLGCPGFAGVPSTGSETVRFAEEAFS